jgi:hypothetical protein
MKLEEDKKSTKTPTSPQKEKERKSAVKSINQPTNVRLVRTQHTMGEKTRLQRTERKNGS